MQHSFTQSFIMKVSLYPFSYSLLYPFVLVCHVCARIKVSYCTYTHTNSVHYNSPLYSFRYISFVHFFVHCEWEQMGKIYLTPNIEWTLPPNIPYFVCVFAYFLNVRIRFWAQFRLNIYMHFSLYLCEREKSSSLNWKKVDLIFSLSLSPAHSHPGTKFTVLPSLSLPQPFLHNLLSKLKSHTDFKESKNQFQVFFTLFLSLSLYQSNTFS